MSRFAASSEEMRDLRVATSEASFVVVDLICSTSDSNLERAFSGQVSDAHYLRQAQYPLT